MRLLKYVLAAFAAVVLIAAGALAYGVYYFTDRVEGDYFDSGGVMIHYTREGEGTPLILLHGFAVHSDVTWRKQGYVDAFKGEYEVITMDFRGLGLSEKPHDPEAYGDEMARDVVRLMDHLGIEKTHLAGYSLGGFMSLKLAVMHPERFYTVMPLGAGWENVRDSDFFDAMPKLEQALRSGKGIKPLSSYLDEDREEPGLLHTMLVKILTGYLNDKQAIIAMIKAIPEIAITEEEAGSIELPMLTVAGANDSLAAGSKALHDLAPDHKLVIVPGRDHIQLPRSPEMRVEMKKFLDAHKTGKPD